MAIICTQFTPYKRTYPLRCGKAVNWLAAKSESKTKRYIVAKRKICYNRDEQGKDWRMSDTKIQWHSGFVAAMSLEFGDDRERLIFEKEYNLNTKPLEVDLLVIKKDPGVQMANEIGKLFRRYNLLEYKSPEDHMDIDTFYKTNA